MTAPKAAALSWTLGVSALALFAAPARADLDLAPVDACIVAALAAGQAPSACVDAAHAPCMAEPEDAPAVASLCFVGARDDWSAGIAGLMQTVKAGAPDELAAVIGIEVKYDLLGGLLQCDRLEELALAVGALDAERIALQKTRCAAVASGLAYVRLKARIETLE